MNAPVEKDLLIEYMRSALAEIGVDCGGIVSMSPFRR